jgi:hypothetical protein
VNRAVAADDHDHRDQGTRACPRGAERQRERGRERGRSDGTPTVLQSHSNHRGIETVAAEFVEESGAELEPIESEAPGV